MKTLKLISVAAFTAVLLSSCYYDKGNKSPEVSDAQVDSLSYAIGMYLGKNIVMSDFGEINLCEMKKGFNDILNEEKTLFDDKAAMDFLNKYMLERQRYVDNKRLEDAEALLEENKSNPDIVVLESGLQYEILEEGDGISPTGVDTVEVHYKGTFVDGKEFDSSYGRGQTATFPLENVVKGFTEGLQYVKEGGKIRLYVPYDLGYGEHGGGPIPPKATLIFEVELFKVMKANPEVEAAPATEAKKMPAASTVQAKGSADIKVAKK